MEVVKTAKRSMKQVYAIQKAHKERLMKVNPKLNDGSGIYFLTRKDEKLENVKYFYIGQAKDILARMISHCMGYQHIDLSIKKRGFYSRDNPYGWKVNFLEYPISELDKWEQYWIAKYMEKGYQARYNKTAGGQGEGKEKINEYRPQKGYRDGLRQGQLNLARSLNHIINTHLTISIRQGKENNKVSQKAFQKFNELLNEDNYKGGDD